MSQTRSSSGAASAASGSAVAITPSDSTDLAATTRALWVGVGGNVKVTLVDDDVAAPVIFIGVPSGSILPVYAKRVWSTGTTASSILGLQ